MNILVDKVTTASTVVSQKINIDSHIALLAQQLSGVCNRLCDNKNETELVEKTIRLVLEALDIGQISLNMKEAVLSSGFDAVDLWKQKLIEIGVAAEPEGFAPLIVDNGHLYLARYHLYHSKLNQRLNQLSVEEADTINEQQTIETLNRLFPATDINPNWQKIAAALALTKRLCVISGGPGTGKTTTVLRLLAALCTTNNKLRIRLAAPTGKAAARMQESIRKNLADLDCDESIKQQLQLQASTLHRLLGYKAYSVNFKHHAENPLAVDVLVIDESSMIDSAMMAKCLDALPDNARIILLGDKDQLAAVEPGSPFASICKQFGFSQVFAEELSHLSGQSLADFTSDQPKALADNLVFLHHSYRFGEKSGIGQLARAINAGENSKALALMVGTDYADIEWVDYQAQEYRRYSSKELDPLITKVQEGFKPFLNELHQKPIEPEKVFKAFNQFCLLTAMHKGFCGRIETNKLCQKALGFTEDKIWFHGRPVMVSNNDYQTGLYNGDVGICLDLESNGQLRVYFPTSEGFKDFTPSRIPIHETAFAMTVHKSQGSEFTEVLFLLPDIANPVFNKALVYTAITRAKERVELWGRQEVFLACES
tara:strand:+ start:14828 stop:16621 length:1794 start_codon:yes stop_codon:yes gene_type:complete